MEALVIVIHVITCLIMVVTVLLQQGKGAEVGAVFGSSEAIFGSAGPATLLSKITTACAIIFMLTSLTLTYMSLQKKGEPVVNSVTSVPSVPAQQAVPTIPEEPKEKATVNDAGDKKANTMNMNSQSVNSADAVKKKGADSSPDMGESKIKGKGSATQKGGSPSSGH